MVFGTVDDHLGRAGPAIVVRRHHEAVGAGTHHSQQVAGLRLGQVALTRKEVAALAYRADDIGGNDASYRARNHVPNIVKGLVQHGPDQVIHRTVDYDKALDVGLLDVEYARHQDTRVADQHAPRLDDQLEAEALERAGQG